jgi:hypothetical protein
MACSVRAGAVPLSLLSVIVQVISNTPEVKPASEMIPKSTSEGELIIVSKRTCAVMLSIDVPTIPASSEVKLTHYRRF